MDKGNHVGYIVCVSVRVCTRTGMMCTDIILLHILVGKVFQISLKITSENLMPYQ